MASTAPSGYPDDELKVLCDTVASWLPTHRPADALVCCWLTLANKDPTRFRTVSTYAHTGGSVTTREQFEKLKAEDWQSCADIAAELFRLARPCPVVLIQFFDHVLEDQGARPVHDDGRDPYTEDIYSGPCLKICLSPQVLAALQVDPHFACCFVIRRAAGAPVPPAQRQASDLNRFNPHWYVVPEIPEIAQPRRRIKPYAATVGLRTACAYIQTRGKALHVYLAELECKPAFESELSGASGSPQAWLAKGLHNVADVSAEVIEHLVRAKELQADVVVFPELTIPGAIKGAIQDWISDNNTPSATDDHAIGWVVAGSFHEEDTKSTTRCHHNRAFAVDRSGDTIEGFTHRKITQVTLKGGYITEANLAGEEIGLQHSPLGIQTVVICLDLAQAIEPDRLPLHLLPINWLWVPSLSEEVSAHQSRARNINLSMPMRVICANQAKAAFPPGAMELKGSHLQSFVTIPAPPSVQSLSAVNGGTAWQLFHIAL